MLSCTVPAPIRMNCLLTMGSHCPRTGTERQQPHLPFPKFQNPGLHCLKLEGTPEGGHSPQALTTRPGDHPPKHKIPTSCQPSLRSHSKNLKDRQSDGQHRLTALG